MPDQINVAAVAARLKAVGDAEDQEQAEAGRAAGRRWAAEDAGKWQLGRLARRVEMSDGNGSGTPGYYVGVHNNGLNHGHAAGLYKDLAGDDGGGAAAFWEDVLGDDGQDRIEDADFALGFIEGALEVWEAVRGQF